MNPYKLAIQLWLIVGFMFVIPQITFCQQFSKAITLQNSDGIPIGVVKVILFHKSKKGKLTPFSGTGGEFGVSSGNNDFICRFENLTLSNDFEGNPITFELDKINFKTACEVKVLNKIKKLDLRERTKDSKKDSQVNIELNVQGTGEVRASFPYLYKGEMSTIARTFTLQSTGDDKTEKKKDKKLSSREIGKQYDQIDKTDKNSLESFVSIYGENKRARKYINSANREINSILIKERSEAQSKIIVKSKDEGQIKEPIHSIEELPEDVETIVDNINKSIKIEKSIFNQLSISYGANVKTFSTATNEQPIQILFSKLGEQEPDLLNGISLPRYSLDTGLVISEKILNDNNIVGKFSSFTIRNAKGHQLFKDQFDLSNQKSSSQSFLWIIIIGTLLVIGGYFVLANKRKKEKLQAENRKKIADKLNQNAQQLSSTQAPVQTNVGTSSNKPKIKAKIKIGSKSDAPKVTPVAPQGSVPRKKTTSRIKISTKRKAGIAIPIDELTKYVQDKKAIHLNLKTMWNDSTISDVFITSTFVEELDNFLAESSSEGIQNELQGAVPEVGGFMMGKYAESKDGLHVVFEKFVPFVPEYNDVFKIEIGTKTIVDELGDAQDKNPKMEVVGWFHTHPGHGLFLSTSDLSVQRHFAKNYQVAMEIDSLTEGLDMSIFTRKNTGRMNNANDRLSQGWFQWVDVENMNIK